MSRTLSHPDRVAPETRARVLEIVAELDYQPNQLARSLRKQNTRIVGLVLSDVMNESRARIAQGVQNAAFHHGFTVVLASTEEDREREARCLEDLHCHRFRGLVVVPTEHTRGHLERYRATPVVEVDRASGRADAHVVLIDNAGGSGAAVRHLAGLGHERIAIIRGRLSITTGAERLCGYLDAMTGAGLQVRDAWIVGAERHDERGGFEAARALLALPGEERPTALLAFNEEVSAGALRAAHEAGLRVPDDLSVVGFDDSRWAQRMSPALTVVAQPAYDMGYLAAERLFSLFRSPGLRGHVTRLDARLVVRASTAPPGHGRR